MEERNMKWKQALHRAYVGIILGGGKEHGDKYIARDYVADSAGIHSTIPCSRTQGNQDPGL